MKKLILSAFAFCIYAGGFAQILPPVNVWTPGGGNIFFNGGNVGIGLNNPQYSLHINGDAVISKSIGAHAITSTTLRTDTLTSGAISAQTIQVGGRGSFLGGIYVPSIKITGFAGVNNRQVIVDTGGNLRVGPGISYPGAACTPGAPSWVFGGNNPSNTNFPDPRIGTCDMSDFVLMAHSVSSIYIKPSGFVGIGANNNNPLAQLDVLSTNGKAFRIHQFDQADNDHEIFNINSDGSTTIFDLDPNLFNPILTMTHSNGTTLKFMANGTGDISSSGALRPHFANTDFSIWEGTPGSGLLRLKVASGGEVSIPQLVNGSNGSVGPYHALMVDATGKLVSNSQVTAGTNGMAWILGGNMGTGGNATLGTTDANGFSFITNNNPCMTITSAGFVHIIPQGVSTQIIPNGVHANALFSVAGEAIFKSAFVNVMTWADYVFEKNYNLLSLNDVEKYYLQNKHLPGVPTEKEMEAQGDNIAEIDAMLLKKIEELTIYVVEQQKQINVLEKKLDQLKK